MPAITYLALALSVTSSASAATIIVNTSSDVVANDGLCSLREAITAANTDTASGAVLGECVAGTAGLDTISFAPLSNGAPATVIALANALGSLPVINQPISIDCSTDTDFVPNTAVSGTNSVPQIQIDGALLGVGNIGFQLHPGSNGSTIRGCIITNFSSGAIDVLSSNNTIAGNFIGSNQAGTSAQQNGAGITIISFAGQNPSNNMVGGSVPADRNLIAGNRGVFIGSGNPGQTLTGNTVRGNLIGTNAAGTAAMPGATPGIGIHLSMQTGGSLTSTTIGGTTGTFAGNTCSGYCNLISGNTGGIVIDGPGQSPQFVDGVTIQGNFVGTNAAGAAGVGNPSLSFSGIDVRGANANVTIGGTSAAARNIVSGHASNQQRGIHINQNLDLGHSALDPNTTVIQGNYIGLSSDGQSPIPNNSAGIAVTTSFDVTIGGTAAGAGNVVAANGSGATDAGILVVGAEALSIQGNLVGFAADGTTPLPNTFAQINIGGALNFMAVNNAVVGAAAPGGLGGNSIVFPPGQKGITVLSNVLGTTFFSNSIRSTTGTFAREAIDLGNDAPTQNDSNDTDTGPNNVQNFPVLTSATSSGGNTTIIGTLNSDANQTFTIEFFANPATDHQARAPIGSTMVTTVGNDASINVTLPVSLTGSDVVTATATRTLNGTSEVSAGVSVVVPLAAPAVSKAFTPSSIVQGSVSTLTITLTNTNGTAITGVTFTDTYPATIANASAPNGATTCPGGNVTAVAGGGSVALNGATIPASSSCTVTVDVTSSTPGTHTNTIAAGAVTTSNTGPNGSPASADLIVTALVPPELTKAFAPSSIAPGGTSTLTITLANSNGTAITGVAFTDTYPAAVSNAPTPNGSTTCTGGSVTAVAAGGSVALSGATIPASSGCTVTVDVTSATPGVHSNTIAAGDVSSSNAGTNPNPASADLTVSALAASSATKSFTPPSISPGQSAVLTITLSNSNGVPITGVAFTDNYPAGIVNTATPTAATTCGGVVNAAANGNSLSLSGGTIPANGGCTATVNVTLLTGTQGAVNTIPAGGITSANAPPSEAAATAALAAQSNIPTLSWEALAALMILLGVVAVMVIRR